MRATIRLARPKDAESISALILKVAETFLLPEFTPAGRERFREAVSPESIEGYLATGYRYHVAQNAGRLVGVVATRDESHLYHLFVAEDWHGKGLARRLWGVARAASASAGHTGDFTVNASRYAVEFYRRLGFVIDGPEDDSHGIVSIPMRLPIQVERAAN